MKNIIPSARTGGIESALSLTARACKRSILAVLRGVGVSAFVAQSGWRNRRLLILCYHGVSLEDEHDWSPRLYVSPLHFENRLRILKQSANVLSLAEGLKRLAEGSLPDRSVAITFDDGFHDFHTRALPLLTKYGIPATVHLTTYYSDFRRPIFELICSYMLWKRRHTILEPLPISNWTSPVNLAESRDREFVLTVLNRYCDEKDSSGVDKDRLAAQLAQQLGIDYGQLIRQRVLQIMSPEEVRDVARNPLVSIQLHTHRHVMPNDSAQLIGEINDNRSRIEELTGQAAIHLAYPSSVHGPEFLESLKQCGVLSAMTIEPGLVDTSTNPMLMPRLMDQSYLDESLFEDWIGGIAAWLPKARSRSRGNGAEDHLLSSAKGRPALT